MKFEDMDVWKRASRLAVGIYQELAQLTDYGLRDQITRSGLSIPSNIAEGFGRGGNKEFTNFLQSQWKEMQTFQGLAGAGFVLVTAGGTTHPERRHQGQNNPERSQPHRGDT